jgi:hypothetical protein
VQGLVPLSAMYRGIQKGYKYQFVSHLASFRIIFKRWVSYIVSLDFIDNVDSAIGGHSLHEEELDVDEFIFSCLIAECQ